MFVEGRGEVPPADCSVVMQGGEMLQLLDEAKRRADFRGYSGKSDDWSRGLKPATTLVCGGVLERHIRPIFAGLMGEWATALVLSRKLHEDVNIDLVLRQRGDDGRDLVVFGVPLQVKCRQSEKIPNLVRDYRLRKIQSRGFVFCSWPGDAVVRVLGWCTRSIVVDKARRAPARRGCHTNAEIDDRNLEPMGSLADALTGWRLSNGPNSLPRIEGKAC